MKTEYIILALNTVNDEAVLTRNGIKVIKELVSSYQGQEERSFLVRASSKAMVLAEAFNQDSVLRLSPLGNAQIVLLPTLKVAMKGEWTNVGRKQPDSLNWTYDIEEGDYYVIGNNSVG